MDGMDGEIGPARRTAGVRTGGRSERVVAAVLHAALAELARVGYAGLRHEDVATKAGVAKTTIYRRWPTKVELVKAAIQEFGRWDDPLPDTGALREDLWIILEAAMKKIATPEGRAIARMVVIERADPQVDALCRELKDHSRKHRAEVVVRAQKRGDLPKDADADLLIECVFGLVMGRTLRFGEKVDRPTCERLIDLVVTGAEHGGGKQRR
jgi:AcrR family transcriptional regulator